VGQPDAIVPSAVVRWLESPEGQAWSRKRNYAGFTYLADIKPGGLFSAIADTEYHLITAPDAAHDPCGRGPLLPGAA